MISRLVFLLFCGNIALNLGNTQKLPRVKRQSLKVQINATGDAVCMRYIRPSPSIRLEGFILGYGSSFFSNQYIPLPSDGKPYITEVDAEPRYLIAVRPAPVPNYRKSCSGQTKTPKPLQLVIGTLTPTSVFLSWGVLVNPKHDWITMNNCANDRFYTVRYREKDKNKKWILQLCPTTETVVDNLKPNTVYEFGVKDNTDNGIWSKIFNHNTVGSYKNKENGHLQKLPRLQTQLVSIDSKSRIPVTIIKEVIQNITHRTQSKTKEKSPLAGPILDFNQTKQKRPAPLSEDMSERQKKILAENETNEWPAESKTSEIQEITPQSQPATTELYWESSKPTISSVSEVSESFPAHTESELDSSKPRISPMAELELDTMEGTSHSFGAAAETSLVQKDMVEEEVAEVQEFPQELEQVDVTVESSDAEASHKFPEFPKIKIPPTLQTPKETLASREIQPVSSQPQTTAPKTAHTKPAVINEPLLEPLIPKTSKPLDRPRATRAPSETALTPFKRKPSATTEGWLVKPASKAPPLDQNEPKISTITEQLKTTPALPEMKFLPSTSKPARPKIPEIKPAEKEPQWETTTPKIYKTPELPRTTPAPKTKITVSKPQILPHLEEPKTVPASSEPIPSLSQSKDSDHAMPEVPDKKLASAETDTFSSKPSTVPELPFTKSVLEPITFNNELPIVDPKVKYHLSIPKTTISPHVLYTKPVLKTVALRTQLPKTEIEEEDHVPLKPKILFSPDAPQTKPDLEASTFGTEQAKSTAAPKETHRVPARPKTSASPDITSTKPGPKGSRRVVPRPKTSPSPHITQTKPAVIITFSHDPITTVTPHTPEREKATPASAMEHFIPNKSKPSTRPRILETKPAVYQITSQLPTIKPTMPSERLKATMASRETQFIPSKPQTSGKLEISMTKPVPFKLPSGETTERPHLQTASHKVYLTTAKPKMMDKSQARPVMHKTTPAPGRTRTSGRLIWGDILTDQDTTRRFSTSSSTSTDLPADSTVAKKKIDSVATPPEPPRPPLAPAKPTTTRRKPLPPNTVTGKPGSSGNILMPRGVPPATASSVAKPMRPTTLVRTGSPKKPPTASSSPDYSNTTVFSSQPTSETDIAGKPRYKGDHVKYVKKEENIPCSITDTLQLFPKEEGDNKDEATKPPQNPPTNLTVVTVEGCPSFVVLDWEKPKNDTVTEYKVVSTENGATNEKDKSIITTNLTHSTVENLKPNTSYEFLVIPSNPLGEGPSSEPKPFKTESADPRINEQISMGKDAIWTEKKFNSDDYSECKGKQYVKRTWYKKFVGVQLCNSLRYKIYLSDSLTGKFYNIGDQRGHGEDHCQFVDSYFDGKTGQHVRPDQLPTKDGFFRAFRQEPVKFGKIGAATHTNYVHWYECGTSIPGKW